MAELQPVIVFHVHHFVRHLGICHPICVELVQLLFDIITQNSVKNEVYLNKWLSYSQL